LTIPYEAYPKVDLCFRIYCGFWWYNYSMSKVIVEENNIKILLSLSEKIWSFHVNFYFPTNQIASLEKTAPKTSLGELRFPGTFFPYLIKAGTYYKKGSKEFWYRTYSKKYLLSINLKNSKLKRIVLGFTTPSERDYIY